MKIERANRQEEYNRSQSGRGGYQRGGSSSYENSQEGYNSPQSGWGGYQRGGSGSYENSQEGHSGPQSDLGGSQRGGGASGSYENSQEGRGGQGDARRSGSYDASTLSGGSNDRRCGLFVRGLAEQPDQATVERTMREVFSNYKMYVS
jgi:hypothetical protein